VTRTVLFIALLVAYAAAFGQLPTVRANGGPRFDPLDRRPHAIEQLIVAGRFDEALQPATDLQRSFRAEPLLAYWLATIHHGLNQWQQEATAWEEYLRLSPTPADACPALPEAYMRLGWADHALVSYERCATFDPRDPESLIDLGRAYERAGRLEEAGAQYRRAADLEPNHPAARITGGGLAAR